MRIWDALWGKRRRLLLQLIVGSGILRNNNDSNLSRRCSLESVWHPKCQIDEMAGKEESMTRDWDFAIKNDCKLEETCFVETNTDHPFRSAMFLSIISISWTFSATMGAKSFMQISLSHLHSQFHRISFWSGFLVCHDEGPWRFKKRYNLFSTYLERGLGLQRMR